MDNNCIFCKIIKGEIKSEKHYEDENFIIISDISKRAKYHYLLIPKTHYKLLSEMTEKDAEILGGALKKLPHIPNLRLENGYRLIINQGENAGQTVFHLHIHVLAGQKMGFNPA